MTTIDRKPPGDDAEGVKINTGATTVDYSTHRFGADINERIRTTVELHCAVSGCAGFMVASGIAIGHLGRNTFEHRHRCSMCGIEELLSARFPHHIDEPPQTEGMMPFRIRFWYFVHDQAERLWHWVHRTKLQPWHEAHDAPLSEPSYHLLATIEPSEADRAAGVVARKIYGTTGSGVGFSVSKAFTEKVTYTEAVHPAQIPPAGR